jgi:hypothetical protein
MRPTTGGGTPPNTPPDPHGPHAGSQRAARPQSWASRIRRLLARLAVLGILLVWGVPLVRGMLGPSTMPALRAGFDAAVDFGQLAQPYVIVLVFAALLAQLVALWAWRQRRRLVEQVTTLLKINRVTAGAATVWVGLLAPRRGTIPVPTGFVADDRQLDDAAKAVTRKWGRPYRITHDERRDRLRIRRTKDDPTIEAGDAETYVDAVHERLAQVRGELPLSVTAIEVEDFPIDVDGNTTRVYQVHFTPTPNVTIDSWRQRVGSAILALVGEPTSTPLGIEWRPSEDQVWLTEEPQHVDQVHERLVATKDSWPVRVLSLDPVPEEMFDGTPTTSYRVRYQPNPEATKRAWQRTAGESIAGLVGATPSGTRLVASWEPSRDEMWLREVPVLPRYVEYPVIEDYAAYLKEGRDDFGLPVALTDLGTPAVWNISPKIGSPHALLAGGTGKGKTTAERTLIISALRRGVPVILIDPKTFELIQFAGEPGVMTIASDPGHIAAVIYALERETTLREKTIAREQLDKNNRDEVPLFVIVIDELMVLSALLTQWTREQNAGKSNFDGDRTRNPVEVLAMLIVRIRAVGGRFLIVTQRPDADQLAGGAARDSLSFRMAMSRMSRDGDQMLWDGMASTQHLDESIVGRSMTKLLTGDVSEAQAWFTPTMDRRERTRAGMTQAERDLADRLRSSYQFKDNYGLFLPAAEAEPLLRPPEVLAGQDLSLRSPYQAILESKVQRYVRELRPGLRIVVDIDGELVPALLVDIEDNDQDRELEVRVEGEKRSQVIVYDRDDTIAVFPDDPDQ